MKLILIFLICSYSHGTESGKDSESELYRYMLFRTQSAEDMGLRYFKWKMDQRSFDECRTGLKDFFSTLTLPCGTIHTNDFQRLMKDCVTPVEDMLAQFCNKEKLLENDERRRQAMVDCRARYFHLNPLTYLCAFCTTSTEFERLLLEAKGASVSLDSGSVYSTLLLSLKYYCEEKKLDAEDEYYKWQCLVNTLQQRVVRWM
ncbi:MAG: hypothetical protein OXC30_00580 [Alphaproteobacteria bacterium]|nr:hypothetical protein [Alphaproteobacteria bacterium]